MRPAIDVVPTLVLSVAASSLAVLVGYKWYQRQQQQERPSEDEGKQLSPLSTSGSIFAPHFLATVRPLYDLHMGCENMGPMLYSLMRFLKPNRVLEVGAGYTSIYLLQALKDNGDELKLVAKAKAAPGKVDKLVEDMFLNTYHEEEVTAALHVMDNMEHESTTAHLVMEIAKKLQCSESLKVIVADCFDYQLEEKYDFIWLDGITTDDNFPTLFEDYWNKHLKDGGYIAIHSTLTNTVTRKWIAELSNRKKREQEMTPVRFDIKPLTDEIDLEALAKQLQAIGGEDVEWRGEYRLEPIGFGIQKLILSALVKDFDAAQSVAEQMENDFDEQVGSVDVVEDEDSRAQSADFQFMSFLEPHKRFQNSFSIFQKRTSNYREKIYSWSP